MIKIIHSLQVNIGKIHLKVIFLNSFFERFVKAPIKTNDINSIYTWLTLCNLCRSILTTDMGCHKRHRISHDENLSSSFFNLEGRIPLRP